VPPQHKDPQGNLVPDSITIDES